MVGTGLVLGVTGAGVVLSTCAAFAAWAPASDPKISAAVAMVVVRFRLSTLLSKSGHRERSPGATPFVG